MGVPGEARVAARRQLQVAAPEQVEVLGQVEVRVRRLDGERLPVRVPAPAFQGLDVPEQLLDLVVAADVADGGQLPAQARGPRPAVVAGAERAREQRPPRPQAGAGPREDGRPRPGAERAVAEGLGSSPAGPPVHDASLRRRQQGARAARRSPGVALRRPRHYVFIGLHHGTGRGGPLGPGREGPRRRRWGALPPTCHATTSFGASSVALLVVHGNLRKRKTG